MSIKQLIGQLLMVGFSGQTINRKSPVVENILERNLGGVILFDRLLAQNKKQNNITSAEQVRKLTDDLQSVADGKLLIAVDQEGGRVCRFRHEAGFPQIPSAEQLGNCLNTSYTRDASAITAKTLKNAGCNLNFAPVVDLNIYKNNPIIGQYGRSFSDSAATVVNHASAWIEEHHKQRVCCCLKHFPGHGSSHKDSHLGFVDISDSWQKEELTPYRQLLATDLVDCVMTGHLYNRVLDSEYPATLSAPTIHLLKNDLGFTGPVFSDDLQMKAITNRYGLAQAACMALSAGVDMLIIGNNLEHDEYIMEKIVEAVVNNLKHGSLTEDRLQDAYNRIQILKKNAV